MVDDTMPSMASIRAVIAEHHTALDLTGKEPLTATPIGQGEANTNVLITVDGARRLNLRIGLRGAESAASLQRELATLQIAPPGIAPRAYAIDASGRVIDAPYMLLDYVAGEEKRTWTDGDLRRYAVALADLHAVEYAGHGPVGQIARDPFDFVHRFDVAVDYWETNHPELFAQPLVADLLAAVRRFVVERNPLFLDLTRFSLVHGDAHPQNILFGPDGFRLIDWEWSVIGDPAMDVAMLGWDIATAWQIALTGRQLETFLAAYLARRTDPTLRPRRDAWMVYTMCFDQMYHRTQLAHDPDGRQALTVERIERYLATRFLGS